MIHSAYDVPGKASDNEEMFDASEEVYNHILCCICPVKLSEPGLSYNEATNAIEERPRDWWVQTPMTGFLFPAFNDRSSDIHGVLYFSRNPEELHSEFIDACLGAPTPISFKSQKEAFQDVYKRQVLLFTSHIILPSIIMKSPKCIHRVIPDVYKRQLPEPHRPVPFR